MRKLLSPSSRLRNNLQRSWKTCPRSSCYAKIWTLAKIWTFVCEMALPTLSDLTSFCLSRKGFSICFPDKSLSWTHQYQWYLWNSTTIKATFIYSNCIFVLWQWKQKSPSVFSKHFSKTTTENSVEKKIIIKQHFITFLRKLHSSIKDDQYDFLCSLTIHLTLLKSTWSIIKSDFSLTLFLD